LALLLLLYTPAATPALYPLSLHDALPISPRGRQRALGPRTSGGDRSRGDANSARGRRADRVSRRHEKTLGRPAHGRVPQRRLPRDRKSTRLNSSHVSISYAVFCLKKKRNF